MAQFDTIRYSPLGNTKSYTKPWTSPRRNGLQISALTALVLAVVIVFGFSIGAYNEYISRIAAERPFIIPSSSRTTITTTATVTVTSRPIPTGTLKPTLNEWSFDSQRESNDYGLSALQCDVAFQPLFEEITRASIFTKKNGRISPSDLDISWTKEGAVHALIQDRQLYILSTTELEPEFLLPRAIALLQAIYRAILTSPEYIPNTEFSFSISDWADPDHLNKTIWSLSRLASQENKWVMSDFGYFSWPMNGLIGSYEQVRAKISEREPAWEDKSDKALWRGLVTNNAKRQDLINVAQGKEWSDVRGVEWTNAKTLTKASQKYAVSMVDHCAYRYLVGTEGQSYSGRLKYLQNCHSTLLMPPPTWIEPHHSALIASGPDQNYVALKQDFSDLDEKMRDLLKNEEKAKRIADNSVKMFRDGVLSPAAQVCYWRRMLREWRDVSFEPDSDAWKRGTPFETWIIESHETCSWFKKVYGKC